MLIKILIIVLLISHNISFCLQLEENLNTETCDKRTVDFMSSLNIRSLILANEEITKFLMFSGNNMNDFGKFKECNKMVLGLYLVIEFSIANELPVYQGICYFRDCGLDYLNNNRDYLVDYISKQYNIKDINLSSIQIIDPKEQLLKYRNLYLKALEQYLSYQ